MGSAAEVAWLRKVVETCRRSSQECMSKCQKFYLGTYYQAPEDETTCCQLSPHEAERDAKANWDSPSSLSDRQLRFLQQRS